MKHYLLTWYGMTDLRAAVGLETTDGPILSALKTGNYTDIVILAYTDPSKTAPATAIESTAPVTVREADQRAIDSLSNTQAAHDLFVAWLAGSLAAADIAVRVQVVPQVLSHLNDAAEIHKAATAAVRIAVADTDEKQITTYVSPGTPVMAFTWALIARSNPQLRLRVISSSDPRRPPEEIALPTSLLNPAIGGASSIAAATSDYDLVIHLLGEQVMPIFFALRQFTAKRHVILTTRNYRDEVNRLAKVTAVGAAPVMVADPFKPADTKKAIAALVEPLPDGARVAVNMTGGTKLMFAGALNACWELALDPFYFEIKNHNVIFLRDGSQVPFVGISDVEDFLRAGDFRTVSPGRWPAEPESIKNRRLPATQDMWQRRDALRALYRDKNFLAFSNHYERHYPRQERDSLPFSFTWSNSVASLNEGGMTKLVLRGKDIPVPTRGLFPFLAGGWLEEYVYSLLRPLEGEGVIRDVRVGFEAGFRQDSTKKHDNPAQEFDCTFTDGKRLWIVECKAGPVKQEAIQKLENNLRLYGGIAARGVLISSFPLTEANQSRIDAIPEITGVNPDRLSTDTLRLIILTA